MKKQFSRVASLFLVVMLILGTLLPHAAIATVVTESSGYSETETSTVSEPTATEPSTDETESGEQGETESPAEEAVTEEANETESPAEEAETEEANETESPAEEAETEEANETESPVEEVETGEANETESPAEEAETGDENIKEPVPMEPTPTESDSPESAPAEPNPDESSESGQVPTAPIADEGTYSTNYTIIEAEETTTSVVDQYFEKPATVITENEQTYVHIALNHSDWITRFSVEYDGVFIEAQEISRDDSENTKVVQFQVDDASAWVNARVEVYNPELGSQEDYHVRIALGADYFAPAPEMQFTLFTLEEPEEIDYSHEVNFTVLEDGTDKTSIMDGYTEKPALVKVEDDTNVVYITLKNSDWIKTFQVEQDGSYIDAEVVREDEENDTRVVKFEVEDLSAKLNVQTHIDVPDVYATTHTVQFQFDVTGLPGYEVPQPELADGRYDIAFTVLKDGTDAASVMDGYTEKPATLVVEEGQNRIYLTLTNSDWIKEFQTEVSEGEFVDADVISIDEVADTRVVGFNVSDFSEKLNAKTHVKIPDGVLPFPYDNRYDVQFRFDPASIVEGTEGPEPGEAITEPEAPAGEPIKFRVLHETKDAISSMNKYVVSPGILTKQDNKQYVSFTLKSSNMITSFEVEQEGTFVPTEVLSEDPVANTRVVQFEVSDVSEIILGKVSVDTGVMGVMTHTVRLEFGKDQHDPIEEPIKFRVLHETKAAISSMNKYVVSPGILAKQDNKQYVSFTLKSSNMITSFEVEQGGTFVPTEVLSEDPVANTRVVQFEVSDVNEIILGKVSVDTGVMGVMTHTVRLEFGKDQHDPIEQNPEPPVEGLADGRYDIAFTVLKDGTDAASVMDGYTEKPATLVVEEGQNRIYLTLTNSDWIKEFQTEVSEGEFVDADVISIDEVADTRVVGFNVSDLSEKLNAKTHVKIPDGVLPFPYDNRYDVQFSFDPASIVEGTEGPEPGEAITEPEAPVEELDEIVLELKVPFNFDEPLSTSTKVTAKISISGEEISFNIVLPAGIDSLTVSNVTKTGDESLEIEISVGNLGDRKVTLTLPKPANLAAERAGAFHWNGTVWEYREARVEGNNVIFDTNLSAVKIAEKVDVPNNVKANVSGGKVQLTWDAVAGATYELSRTESGTETVIDNITEANYTDTIGSNATYSYKVRTIKNNHQSAWSSIVSASSAVDQIPGQVNGDYSIDFNILKNNTNDLSVMDSYTIKPAGLTVRDGKNSIAMGLTNSSWITGFKVEQSGELRDVRTISSDASMDTRVVGFDVEDLSRKVNAWVKVDIPEINYHHEYDVQIEFDEGSIVAGVPVLTVEIDPANLRDGEYQADFSVLEKGSYNVSILDEYMKKPLAIKVYDGEQKVSLALKNSSWITHVQVERDGSYVDTNILSTDEKADARVIEFEVDDLTRNIKAKIQTPAAEKVVLKDGEYELQASLLEEQTEQVSVLNNYILPKGSFIVKDGKQYISFTLTNSDQLEDVYLEVEQTVVDISTKVNKEENTRVIEFEVEDVKADMQLYATVLTAEEQGNAEATQEASVARLQVEVPELEKLDTYEVELSIDTDSIKVGAPDLTVEPEKLVLAEGEYTIGYQVVEAGKNKSANPSILEEYLEKPAMITVNKDGKQQITITLLQSDQLQNFQIEQDGTYHQAEVIQEDEEAKTRTITFAVEDLLAEVNIKAQILVAVDEEAPSFETIVAQLQFDPESVAEVVELTEEVIEPAQVDTRDIQFTVLKDGTNQISVMDEYTLKPATVTTKDGKHYVSITLKNSSWTKSFQAEVDGQYIDAEVISVDEAEDTRVVQFEVADLSQKVNVFTHVKIPDGVLPFPYDNKYTVQFQFQWIKK